MKKQTAIILSATMELEKDVSGAIKKVETNEE